MSTERVATGVSLVDGKLDIDDEDVLQYTQYEEWRMWVAVGTDINRKDRVLKKILVDRKN